VIINKLPSACRNIYTAGCYTARKHTHAECTTPVWDTLYSMYNCMYHRPLDSAFDAHLIHMRYNLAFSHQACDSRLITLYNNTSFSAYMQKGTPGCTRTLYPTNIHRVQPYKRATIPMHSAPIPGVHIYCVQHKLDLGLSRTQPTLSRSSRSHFTDITSMTQHVHSGSRPFGLFTPQSVRLSLGQYCTIPSRYDRPLVSTARRKSVLSNCDDGSPPPFFFFTYHHMVFILQGCHVVFTCQGFFPHLL
jgi:hypothetical protein